ncbi:Homologous recombination OB-fold protein-like protein [Drosera capensis]
MVEEVRGIEFLYDVIDSNRGCSRVIGMISGSSSQEIVGTKGYRHSFSSSGWEPNGHLESHLHQCSCPARPSQSNSSSLPSSLPSLSLHKFPSDPPFSVPPHADSQSLDVPSPLHQSPCVSPLSSPRPEQEQIPAPSPKSHRLIPGAAGAIQAAMHRKSGEKNELACGKELEISTQEYLRRIKEDHGEEFMNEPWLSAIDFLQQEGVANRTPLSEVKSMLMPVVAIVKSCSLPNGFGGFMVTLKDPSDTIGASIYPKVMNPKEFCRDIEVGSVLILQKVAVFSPTCSSQYLNVTGNNIIKVFKPEHQLRLLN